MLTLCFFATVLLSCSQSMLTKLYCNKYSDVWVFNLEKSLFAFLLFALASLINSGGYTFHIPTFIYALFYAMSLMLSMVSGFFALACGPMSLTSLIVSFSLVLPSVYGIGVLGESLTAYKLTGFALLAASLILFNINKGVGNDRITAKWALFTALTLVSNGVFAIVQKMHQNSFPGEYTSEFMRDATLICTLIFLAVTLITRARRPKAEREAEKGMSAHIYGITAGLANSGSNFFTLLLSGMADASAVFPMISAGTAVAVFLAGTVFFKEKQSIIRFIALALGVASVVLLKI